MYSPCQNRGLGGSETFTYMLYERPPGYLSLKPLQTSTSSATAAVASSTRTTTIHKKCLSVYAPTNSSEPKTRERNHESPLVSRTEG